MPWKPSGEQGQGMFTAIKQAGLGAVFATSLDISMGGAARAFPYWHIDLNAGCGWNEKADCEGSPLVFLRAAAERGRSVRTYFCDVDPEKVRSLRGNVESLCLPHDDAHVSYVACDNAVALPAILKEIAGAERPKYAVGTCLCDPNGYPHGFPVEAIRAFAAACPRIDLVLNLNVSLFSRVLKTRTGVRPPGFAHWPTPEEILAGLGRAHWMVSSPPRGGKGERFVVAYGQSFDRGGRRFRHFYPLASQQGVEIIRSFGHIPPEQPLLPGME